MKKLLRDPLVHFGVVGLLLLAGVEVLGGTDPSESRAVVLSERDVAALVGGWEAQWGRPPTPDEVDGLVEDHVRQEILYREALALGLDRGDLIVRRRLAQKMEFLASDSAGVLRPTDAELEAFRAEHRERFEVPGQVSFEQVYIGRDHHGDAAPAVARAALEALRRDPEADPAEVGDRFLLPVEQNGLTDVRVEQVFGGGFAEAVFALPVGGWEGPVTSGYGLHLVRVSERTPRRDAELAEVRDRVAREWEAAKREEASRAFYSELRGRYDVRVDRPQ